MRVSVEQLTPLGEDAALIHWVDGAFFMHQPERVGVAVSGGGDSMALLHIAWRWSGLSGVPVEAVTLNHGLRAEAADEAALVAQTCAGLDIAHTTLQWDGKAAQGNLAAAARDARYTLISGWANERSISGVLLGHTLDDIAETFLMRLARKSGVDGLAIMKPTFDRNGVMFARPLWQQRRGELRDYLRRHDIDWADDPSNEDETYDRPKARKALAVLEPLGITADVLADAAISQRSARETLEFYVQQEADRRVHMEHGDVVLNFRVLPVAPIEMERRLMVAAVQAIGGAPYAPRSKAVLDLEIGLSQAGKHTLAGCILTKVKGEVRVAREFNAVKDLEVASDQIWDGRWKFDGPHAPSLTIRALGEHIKDVPDWRDTGLPRTSLMASPAVFDGGTLIAAPVAGLQNGFSARIVADFQSFLLSR